MKLTLIYICVFSITLLSCNDKKSIPEKSLALTANVERLQPEALEVVKNWDGYLALEKNIVLISNTNPLNSIDMMDDLAINCSLMSRDIPEKLELPEIKRQVIKVDREVNEFYAEVNRSETRERVVQEHLQTILKAFDTLNKEINHVL